MVIPTVTDCLSQDFANLDDLPSPTGTIFNEINYDIVVNTEQEADTKKIVNEGLNNVKEWYLCFIATKLKPNTNY